MADLHFTTDMRIQGVNPYVHVTAAQAALLQSGWRKPMPVVVRINGAPTPPWHINMMPMGNGDYYLYLHEIVRKASGTKVGDVVDVVVCFDAEYTGGPEQSPEWFVAALAENKIATANWQRLSPSRQKEVVRSLLRLQSPESQARNLTQLMYVLSGNDGRFMGRVWHDGA